MKYKVILNSRRLLVQHFKLFGTRVLQRQPQETLVNQNLPGEGGDRNQRTRVPHQLQYSRIIQKPRFLVLRKINNCFKNSRHVELLLSQKQHICVLYFKYYFRYDWCQMLKGKGNVFESILLLMTPFLNVIFCLL